MRLLEYIRWNRYFKEKERSLQKNTPSWAPSKRAESPIKFSPRRKISFVNLAIAVTIGVTSGYYIFNEPCEYILEFRFFTSHG